MQATIPLLIILLYSAICLAEAWLEEVVIELKDPYHSNYDVLNNIEHTRSLIYAMLVAVPFLLIAWHYHYYWLLPAIVVNRRMCFDFPLKHFRNKPIKLIEGTGPFDSFFRMIYGTNGGWLEFITHIVITGLSIYLSIHFHG
jgi:hypothetical protein